jgi:hypothetical protein
MSQLSDLLMTLLPDDERGGVDGMKRPSKSWTPVSRAIVGFWQGWGDAKGVMLEGSVANILWWGMGCWEPEELGLE